MRPRSWPRADARALFYCDAKASGSQNAGLEIPNLDGRHSAFHEAGLKDAVFKPDDPPSGRPRDRRRTKLDPAALDAPGGEKQGFGRIEPGRDFDGHDPVRLDMSDERPRRRDKAPVRSTGLRQLPQPRCEVGEKTAVIENGVEVGDEKLFRPARRSAVHRGNVGARRADDGEDILRSRQRRRQTVDADDVDNGDRLEPDRPAKLRTGLFDPEQLWANPAPAHRPRNTGSRFSTKARLASR